MADLNEREAQRRVEKACRMIESAYRLHSLDPKDTLSRVRSAIAIGANEQAEDLAEEGWAWLTAY